jgi:hypothetical protein
MQQNLPLHFFWLVFDEKIKVLRPEPGPPGQGIPATLL